LSGCSLCSCSDMLLHLYPFLLLGFDAIIKA
jgi:hypothetical protein